MTNCVLEKKTKKKKKRVTHKMQMLVFFMSNSLLFVSALLFNALQWFYMSCDSGESQIDTHVCAGTLTVRNFCLSSKKRTRCEYVASLKKTAQFDQEKQEKKDRICVAMDMASEKNWLFFSYSLCVSIENFKCCLP